MRPLALAACVLVAAASSARAGCVTRHDHRGKAYLKCDKVAPDVTVSASDPEPPLLETTPGVIATEIQPRPLIPLPKNPLETAPTGKAEETSVRPAPLTASPNTSETIAPIAAPPLAGRANEPGPDEERAPPSDRTPSPKDARKTSDSGRETSAAEASRIEAAAERAKPMAERGGRAAATASKAAEAMKAEIARAAAGADGATPGGGDALEAAAEKTDGSSDPSRPATPQELALASGSYRDAFAAAGLRVKTDSGGRPSIVRMDGSPASAAEIEGLRASIAREPAALVREPGFFSTISREDYASLKSDYARSSPPGAEFKDVVKTPDGRDFAWSRACDNVSGECNEAARDSYKKDELVSAADLASIWKRIRAGISSRSEDDDIVSRVNRKTADMLARIRGGSAGRDARALGDGALEPPALEAAMIRLPEGAAARAATPSGPTPSAGTLALAKFRSVLGFIPASGDEGAASTGPSPFARTAPWVLILVMGGSLLWAFRRR